MMATMVTEVEVAPVTHQSAPPLPPKGLALAITGLTTSLFLIREHDHGLRSGRRKVVAVTSCSSGEGVTTISSLLAVQLARNTNCRVLIVSPAQLEQVCTSDPIEVKNLIRKNPSIGTWSFEPKSLQPAPGRGRWTQDAFRRALLETLRDLFDYLLIDCPAVDASPDVAQLASLVDGVLLVVSAGRTTRSQILQTQQLIENVGGKLEGCCLNRHTSPTPRFLNRLLGR